MRCKNAIPKRPPKDLYIYIYILLCMYILLCLITEHYRYITYYSLIYGSLLITERNKLVEHSCCTYKYGKKCTLTIHWRTLFEKIANKMNNYFINITKNLNLKPLNKNKFYISRHFWAILALKKYMKPFRILFQRTVISKK